jgi:hypothetical protein
LPRLVGVERLLPCLGRPQADDVWVVVVLPRRRVREVTLSEVSRDAV